MAEEKQERRSYRRVLGELSLQQMRMGGREGGGGGVRAHTHMRVRGRQRTGASIDTPQGAMRSTIGGGEKHPPTTRKQTDQQGF